VSNAPAFTVIGNPANRRVQLFQTALAAQALPVARVIAWRDLAPVGAAARLLAGVRGVLRIDSLGEDDEVERAMIRRGEATAGPSALTAAELAGIPFETGRILAPRQHHLGMCAVLDEIAAALAPEVRVLQPPRAIAELFDKRMCSRKWRDLGIPVPETLDNVRDPDDLRVRMEAAGWASVFVKITSGSSAAGLAVFVHHPQREHVMTTVEDTGTARYNTRKLQRLTRRDRIDRVLGFLLGEGAIVERAIPKAHLAGRYCDLRVLVIDGEPAFVVARTSAHPITNLHLGGLRGDVEALRALVPADAWARAMADCVTVQRASGAFHVGVDLMFEPGYKRHRVIEGNAFGDLLPNLERDGLDVYGWQIMRVRSAA
jgi:glutathione synthase/RimK-type ligase-like ATP-grasp enzyme